MELTEEIKLVEKILACIEEKNGQNPVVLDLRPVSTLCDYFVISSAASERQVKAIAELIKEKLEKTTYALLRQEGFREGRWILMDYGDVVIHLFVTEERDHYRLEQIWKDAPVVHVDTP